MITGLITEYNPFTNGHLHHIEEARRLTGANAIVVVMSGPFVQRGAPAVADPYLRTEMALQGGADLVILLPSLFALSSAEGFARGAVGLLHKLGCVDHLVFGSESGHLAPLQAAAHYLSEEPSSYKKLLQAGLRQGLSFPRSRAMALSEDLGAAAGESMSSPNNILGVEYLKALALFHCPILPHTILRKGDGYHSLTLSSANAAPPASASALRAHLDELVGTGQLEKWMPEEAAGLLYKALKQGVAPLDETDLTPALCSTLWQLQAMPDSEIVSFLLKIEGFDEGLAQALFRHRFSLLSFPEMVESMKSKAYTRTRISRALIHLILRHSKRGLSAQGLLGYAPYAHVLGFSKQGRLLFPLLKEKATLPLITKTARGKELLRQWYPDDAQYRQALYAFEKDRQAYALYRQLVYLRHKKILPEDFRQEMKRI